MNNDKPSDYERVAVAIQYLQDHFQEQPSLDRLAQEVGLNAHHFQKLFSHWAGVSPKKFLQFLSLNHAKTILRETKGSLMDAAYQTGLSGTGRLHDLFINIEAMTPGEYKNGCEGLTIDYGYYPTKFGDVVIASTAKGVCSIFFYDDEEKALGFVKHHYPKAEYREHEVNHHRDALLFFNRNWQQAINSQCEMKLHLKGTPFQLKVWESLLKIPLGGLSTYGEVASSIHNPNACRAVGTAIGSNPVSFLIPCHRVIQSTGNTGNYFCGPMRKKVILGWEAAQVDQSA